MFFGTSLGTVASAVVVTWTAVDSPYIGVDLDGASIAGGGMVLCICDATVDVMGTSATSSIGGGFLDRSLWTALFAALGAVSVGVVVVNPGALRGTGACMTGGGVGGCNGDRGGVSSGLLRIDQIK